MQEFLEDLIRIMNATITPPRVWGVFHACFFAAMLAAAAVILAFSGKLRKRPRLVYALTIAFGVFLLLIEGAKQIYYSLHIDENGLYWDYQWHAFPFQFCSTPLYACIALCFFRRGRIHDALCAFLGTFGAFAGAGVMTTPGAVLIDSLFIDLHTMFWHSSLFLVGVLQWAGKTFERTSRPFFGAAVIFLIFAAIALALDFALPQLADENFNLFYISPYLPCTINILDEIWKVVPYPVFLAIYLLGFIGIAAAIFFAVRTVFTFIEKAIARKKAGECSHSN